MCTRPPEAERRILDRVRAHEGAWIDLVLRLAAIESPSTEAAPQRALQRVLSAELEAIGFETRSLPGNRTGGILLASPRDRVVGAPTQLLLGHTDTVFPLGTLARNPVRIEGGRIRGPGVFDMKGGIAQGIIALRVLHELGLRPSVTPLFLLNSDEEIGSPESTAEIRSQAATASRALVLEPALGADGWLKTARKGTGQFRLRVVGRSAHPGLDPEGGANAIHALAQLIGKLRTLADPARGILLSVGTIRGGTTSNTIPGEAVAEVDARVDSLADAREVEERIRILEATVAGCRVEVEGGFERPPFERTPGGAALWAEAWGIAEEMGIPLEEGRAGGGSDGNTTAPLTPTLDGLGAVGAGAHSPEEFIDVERSLERSAILAALLLLPPTARDLASGLN